MALAALRIEHVRYVTSVRQLSIVFGVLLGNYLLRELFGLIRVFVSIVIGISLIVLFVQGRSILDSWRSLRYIP